MTGNENVGLNQSAATQQEVITQFKTAEKRGRAIVIISAFISSLLGCVCVCVRTLCLGAFLLVMCSFLNNFLCNPNQRLYFFPLMINYLNVIYVFRGSQLLMYFNDSFQPHVKYTQAPAGTIAVSCCVFCCSLETPPQHCSHSGEGLIFRRLPAHIPPL